MRAVVAVCTGQGTSPMNQLARSTDQGAQKVLWVAGNGSDGETNLLLGRGDRDAESTEGSALLS